MPGASTAGDGLAQQLARTRRRVLTAFVLVAVGLALGRALPWMSSAWFALALGACAAAIATKAWACRAALALAIICGSAGWMHARIFEHTVRDLGVLLADTRTLVTLEGTVLRTPREVKPQRGTLPFQSQPRVRLDVDVDTIVTEKGGLPVHGKLWARTPPPGAGAIALPRAGDRIRLTGWFEPIGPPSNPGQDDLREYAAQVGFAGSLTLSSATLLQPIERDGSALGSVSARWLAARAALEDRARHLLTRAAGNLEGEEGERSRALLLGLVLGDYDPSQREVRDAFARQGLAHVLSISGFHLSVMALLALFVLRLSGDRGWLEPALVAVIVLLYVLIVPASSPILRSAAMVLGVMAAEASGRRYDRLTLLTWIAVGLLLWRPLDLWNPGFQLSFGLTACLFWLGPTVHARMFGVPIQGIVRKEIPFFTWTRDKLTQSFSAAVMCWAVSLPLIMHRFGLISPLAIGATILITPLIVLVLWAGYLALLAGVFILPAADWAGHVLAHLCQWSVAGVNLFDAVPFSALCVPVVSGLWCAGATLVIVAWLKYWRWREWRAWGAGALVGAWLALQWANPGGLRRDVALRIDILDVGNGSCYLLRSGDDAVLWDCGPMPGNGTTPPLVGAVRALGAWRTPRVIVTHPDLDHFAGLAEVLHPLGVREVLVPARFIAQAAEQPAGAVAELTRELKARGVPLRALQQGDTTSIGQTTLTFLSPPPAADWPLDNNHSLVALVSTPADPHAALLTGDVQDEAIAALRSTHPGLMPRVLELPHHGSARPAAIDFAWHLNPEVVLQSTGALRADDPRWDGVRVNRTWYTTATDGASWVEFREGGALHSGPHRNRHR